MKRNNPRNLKNIRRINAAKRLEARIAKTGVGAGVDAAKLELAKAELKTLQDRIVS